MFFSNCIGYSGMELVIPVLKIVLDYNHRYVTKLVQPIVFFAVLVRFWYLSYKRSLYLGNREKIDIRFSCVCFPLLLIGCTIGQELHFTASRIIETSAFLFFMWWIGIKCLYSIWKRKRSHDVKNELNYSNEFYFEEGDELEFDSGELQNGTFFV